MPLTTEQIDFIKANSGKISQREIGKIIGVSHGTISKALLGKKDRYNRDVRRAYYKKNKKKINERSKKYYLKNKESISSKLKTIYHENKREVDARLWERKVDEGIEMYHFVMRSHRLPRKMVYKRLRKEFEDMQRLMKAA